MPKSAMKGTKKVSKKGKILGKRSKYDSHPRVLDENGVLRKPNAFKYGPSKKKKGLDGGVAKNKKKKILPVKVDGKTRMLNLKEKKELKTARREARKQRVKAAKQLKLEMEREARKKGMVLERVKGRERLKHPLGLAIRPKKMKAPDKLVPPLTPEQLLALEEMLGRSASQKQKRKEARRIFYAAKKQEKREQVQAKKLAKLEAQAAAGDDAGATSAADQDPAEIQIEEEVEE